MSGVALRGANAFTAQTRARHHKCVTTSLFDHRRQLAAAEKGRLMTLGIHLIPPKELLQRNMPDCAMPAMAYFTVLSGTKDRDFRSGAAHLDPCAEQRIATARSVAARERGALAA
jgi:hypothetical protein